MAESMVSSFWGPVTSTTELCEENYAHSSYIAEFYNTISNIPCIILALIGLINALRQRFEKRFSILHISNMILAIGNIVFHATLQHVIVCTNTGGMQSILFTLISHNLSAPTNQMSLKSFIYCLSCRGILLPYMFGFETVGFRWSSQIFYSPSNPIRVQQSDETPMFWEMLLYLYVLYSPDWHYRSTMPTFLFLYAAAFAITHSLLRIDVLFKVQYILLCLLCVPRMYKYYIHTKDCGAKRIAKFYVATFLLGGLCWLVDRFFCKMLSSWYVNPQGHAWWHVFMGFNSYLANTFLMFCRAKQLGWNPQVDHLFRLFPYVRIQKTKIQ